MAFQYADRVKEATTTTGTGSVTLIGAATGFRAFASALAVGDTTIYCIQGGTEWEVGHGTLTAANVLARSTVIASSAAGALVNFSAFDLREHVAQPFSSGCTSCKHFLSRSSHHKPYSIGCTTGWHTKMS